MFKNLFNLKEKSKMIKQTTWSSTVGWHFVFCIIIGFAMGLWLDKWLGTRYWFTVIFFGYGVVAAFKHLYDGYKAGRW